MPKDCRMEDTEFFGNFLCSRKRSMITLNRSLSTFSGWSLRFSTSRLSSPLQNFLNHCCTVCLLAALGPNALLMLWVVSAAFWPILNSNKKLLKFTLCVTLFHFMANRWGNNGNSGRLYFLGLQNHCRWWLQPWNWETLALWKKSYDKPRWRIKKQRCYFANKGPYGQSYGFSTSHVWMWELDHEEGWAPKNWCFQTVVLEKTLESPLDCKEIKSINLKGNQLWMFIGRTDAEAEALILWPRYAKSQLIGKDLDAGREKAGGDGDNRRWDGWMTSPTQWTWVWVSSGRWWRKGKFGVLQSLGSQRVKTLLRDWTTTISIV